MGVAHAADRRAWCVAVAHVCMGSFGRWWGVLRDPAGGELAWTGFILEVRR